MARYSVAKAKDNLSGLIEHAMRGEEVVITRRGESVVELRAIAPDMARSGISGHEWLKKRRSSRPALDTSSVDLVRQIRDEGY